MAGKNIKGITIEIDGNATGLNKALKDVNSTSAKTNSELKQVNKLLKFDPSNTTLVSQKQELLSKAIKETSDKLNILKGAQAEVEAQFKSGKIGEEQYRAFQRELAETEQSLKSYDTQLERLQSEQDKLGTNTKRLDRLFEATGTNIDDYADILGTRLVRAIKDGTATSDQLEVAINKIGKEALGAETDLQEMKNALDRVDDGESIDNVRDDLNELKTTSGNTDEELGKLGSGITAGNMMQATEIISEAGEKIKEFAGYAQDAFRDIDDGLDTFTTSTGQNSDEIKKAFDVIYTSMPIESTAELGQALGSLSQQLGFTEGDLEKNGLQLMKFANINDADVKTSVDNAKAAIETYGLSYDDFGSILDTVTGVSQGTGVAVEDLMTKAVDGAPQIKALGITFDEAVSLIGQFEQAGVDSSAALGSLSKASVIYAKDGKTLEQGLGETKNAILNAKDETEALTIASKVFGTKGAVRMVDAIKRGTLNLEKFSGTAEASAGTVATTFESTVDPIDKQDVALQNLKLSMSELGATIAEGLQPILDKLIPVVKSMGEIFEKLPTPVKTVGVLIGALVAAFTALAPFIYAMLTIFESLSAAVAAAGGGMLFLTGTLLPIIGIIAGVIAAITAVILIFTHWSEIVDWLRGVFASLGLDLDGIFNSIKETITSVVQEVSEFVMSIWGILVDWWKQNGQLLFDVASDIWTKIWDKIKMILDILAPYIKAVWESIKTAIQTAWDLIKIIVTTAIKVVLDVIKATLQVLKGDWSGAWNTIKGTVSTVWNAIKNAVSTAIKGVASILKNIMEGIKGTVANVWNAIKEKITSPLESAKEKVRNIIDAIKNFFNFSISWPHVPLPHFGISPSGWQIGDLLKGKIPSLSVDWYAKGGILTKPTIFGQNGGSLMGGGEAGKEAVAPLSDLMAYVRQAVAEANGNSEMLLLLQQILLVLENSQGSALVNIEHVHLENETDYDEFGRKLAKSIERNTKMRLGW
jgi:phage-related minor tail protein